MQNDDFVPGRSGAPNLETKTVVGVFDDQQKAIAAARAIQGKGIDSTNISVVAQENVRAPEIGAEDTMAGEGGFAGIAIGAVAGGIVAGVAALVIPGFGTFLAAGPLSGSVIALVAGALTGAGVGLLAGSFSGLSVRKPGAERYEKAVRGGGSVVAVKVPLSEHVEPLQDLLKQQGATEVSSFSPGL